MDDYDINLEELDELLSTYSPESGYNSPEGATEFTNIREVYSSYGNEMDQPYLEIIEQPLSFYRFRYITEFKKNPQGPLTGNTSTKPNKTFPTVKLNNYGKKAIIRCWLCVNTRKQVHFHQLLSKNDGNGTRSEPHDINVDAKNNFTAIFEGLNIIHSVCKGKKYLECFYDKKKRLESGFFNNSTLHYDEVALKEEVKQMEKNKAVLFFEAFDFENKNKLCDIYSHIIKNSKNPNTSTLKIARQSTCQGSVFGNTEIMIFVEKVTKDIDIKFFELDKNGEETWSEYAQIFELWHQVGIAFKTPPYKDLSIDSYKQVYFKLIRKSDGSQSNQMKFFYQPDYKSQAVYNEPVIGKKRRLDISIGSTSPNTPYGLNVENMETVLYPEPLLVDLEVIPPNEPGLMGDSNYENQTDLFSIPQEFVNSIHFQDEIDLNLSIDTDSVNVSHDGEQRLYIDCATDGQDEDSEEETNDYTLARKLFKSIIQRSNSRLFYDTLKEIKKYKIEVQTWKNAYNKTPLHMALEMGRLDFVQPLLDTGFDVNAIDIDKNSALHLAVICEAKSYIITSLIKAGADANVLNNDGETPIHVACKLQRNLHLNLLLGNCITIKCQTCKTGDTPLHIASKTGSKQIATILLKRGADVCCTNFGRCTPLDIAVLKEDEEMVKLLLSFMNPKIGKNVFLVNLIMSRVQNDKMYELLEDFMGRPDVDASENQENELSNLLDKKCNLDEVSR